MLKYTKGNLLDMAEAGEFDMIVHGCNCFNTFGSGIAAQIRERFPRAAEIDGKTVPGDIGKLGNYSRSLSVYDHEYAEHPFSIINAYTQYSTSRAGEDVFEYAAFELILKKLAHKSGKNARIGFPMIGMGLAGGNKQRIISLLEWFEELVSAQGGTVTVVEFG